VAGVAIVGATIASYALGWAIGVPVLLPFFNTLASVPFMVLALRRRDSGGGGGNGITRRNREAEKTLGDNMRLAVGRMLLWALTMGVVATLMSYARPAQTDALFLRGAAYRTEMFAWVMTGRGAESSPSRFVPQHARDAAIFSALALATGGVLAMPMGAALMNYMGHYVGTLAAAGRHPVLAMLLGWHPWSVIRIVSFVVLGVVLSAPLLSRVFDFRVDWMAARPLLIGACAGLVADVVLKTLFAPAWQRLLLRVAGW
jgi:hypothetical protein